jgi:hypothetical protein
MKWIERCSYVAAIGAVAVLSILYANKAVDDSQKISCPVYEILDRPPPKNATADQIRIIKAIHNVRVKYNCNEPLFKSPAEITTTTRTP